MLSHLRFVPLLRVSNNILLNERQCHTANLVTLPVFLANLFTAQYPFHPVFINVSLTIIFANQFMPANINEIIIP